MAGGCAGAPRAVVEVAVGLCARGAGVVRAAEGVGIRGEEEQHDGAEEKLHGFYFFFSFSIKYFKNFFCAFRFFFLSHFENDKLTARAAIRHAKPIIRVMRPLPFSPSQPPTCHLLMLYKARAWSLYHDII